MEAIHASSRITDIGFTIVLALSFNILILAVYCCFLRSSWEIGVCILKDLLLRGTFIST